MIHCLWQDQADISRKLKIHVTTKIKILEICNHVNSFTGLHCLNRNNELASISTKFIDKQCYVYLQKISNEWSIR